MSDLTPDYRPTDGSYQIGGGNWRYGQDLVGQALDMMLTGYTDTTVPGDANAALKPLEHMLYHVPLPVLQMLRPFTGVAHEWDDSYTAVQDIMGAFAPKENRLQEFLDGIASIFTPGASSTPVKDAIDVILGIKTVADLAEAQSLLALLGVIAIRAEQKGGHFDEFDYPISSLLPTADYTAFYGGDGSNTSTWGPDGGGRLVYKQSGVGTRKMWYRRDTQPLPGSTGTVTVVLSRAPNPVVPDADVYVCGQWSAGSQERLQVRVHQTGQVFGNQTATVQFQMVSASGAASNVGSAVANVPRLAAGDALELSWDATTARFKKSGVEAHTVPFAALPGRNVGFGGSMPNYLLPPHPGAEFAGIAWHP